MIGRFFISTFFEAECMHSATPTIPIKKETTGINFHIDLNEEGKGLSEK